MRGANMRFVEHRRGRFLMIGMFLSAIAAMAHAAAPATNPSQLSLEEIAAGVEATQSRISDLTVEVSLTATDPKLLEEARGFAKQEYVATVKGSKYCIRTMVGQLLGDQWSFGGREEAYNGKQTTTHFMKSGQATVETAHYLERDTRCVCFFAMMLLNPPRPDDTGYNDQSLISMTKTKYARVRPEMEAVNGRMCHVIDIMDPRVGRPRVTVWVDCGRSFIPLRHRFFRGPGWAEAFMEYEMGQVIEVKKDLWFPVTGRKRLGPNDVSKKPYEYVMEVKGWREGKPAIKVNEGVGDEFFDLWKRLPKGTEVWDKDADRTWVVEGAE